MDELIVLVPVLDRPQNVVPLVESFNASRTPGQLLFVVTLGDDAELAALNEAGVEYIVTERVTWPHKINVAFRALQASRKPEWVLFGADDVTFHQGWFDATKPFRDQPEINVIGTNDLGNPRVIAGEHTTHALVRGSYLGTVDDPDAIVHTGYSHWCVDDEFVTTAKIRGCWAFAPTAIIEHNHPYWKPDEVPWDATYAKGEKNAEADVALWRERAALLGLKPIVP